LQRASQEFEEEHDQEMMQNLLRFLFPEDGNTPIRTADPDAGYAAVINSPKTVDKIAKNSKREGGEPNA
jgi:hypothetical protein